MPKKSQTKFIKRLDSEFVMKSIKKIDRLIEVT